MREAAYDNHKRTKNGSNYSVLNNYEWNIMDNHRILPFYMTYPLPLFYQEEDKVQRDLEYLQQMYPAEAKRYQRIIASMLDKIDYDGSMIYDEYPDRMRMYALTQDIVDQIKREDMKTDMTNDSPDRWNHISDLVQILLFYEIYKRRHMNHRGILKF